MSITSIHSAINMVGDDEFRKLVPVALPGRSRNPDARAFIDTALERARFCELLAPLMNESASKLYLLGMLSLIDVILELPMARVVEALPIDREMKAALLGEKSSLTASLRLIRSQESGGWQGYTDSHTAVGITEKTASVICKLSSVGHQDRFVPAVDVVLRSCDEKSRCLRIATGSR